MTAELLAPLQVATRTGAERHPHSEDHGGWRYFRADQQPSWSDPGARDEACAELAASPALVAPAELAELRSALAEVAAGRGLVLQAGDCAESFDECTAAHANARQRALGELASLMDEPSGGPVVQIGRIAGQFAKPRSQPFEDVEGRPVPVFRGHIVNGHEADPTARRHDPRRMLRAYEASRAVAEHLAGFGTRTWTSHEALVLDYESALVRFDEEAGGWYLGSAHLPWVGERTRHSESAHTRLLADVFNPVACKVSGSGSLADLMATIERLDPNREPGRLTLITRFGADKIERELPAIADAVRRSGHPVVWLCDPMHGNTVKTPGGVKTRRLESIALEVRGFVSALRTVGLEPGGIHLETAAEPVTECIGADVTDDSSLAKRYTTLCDPRLNPTQAAEIVRTFMSAVSGAKAC